MACWILELPTPLEERGLGRIRQGVEKFKSLHMSEGGTMIHSNPATEPIVPLGRMIEKLGCRLGWDSEGLIVHHPSRGRLPVEDRGGCPHIPRVLALELIEELEEKGEVEMKKISQLEDQEERILWEMIQSHLVL